MRKKKKIVDQHSEGLVKSLSETVTLSKLAAPLILSSLVSMSVSITDVVMMGWIGPTALAAGAAASDFYSIIFYLASGIVAALAPLAAQSRGANDTETIRQVTQQALWTVLLLSPPGIWIIWHSDYFLSLVGVQPDIVSTASAYAHMMALTYVPMLGVMVWHYFLSAHDRTKIILYVTAATLPLNAVGNYLFMFGKWGFPALGLAGAGVSSMLSAVFMFIVFFIYVMQQFRVYRLLHDFRFYWQRMKEILHVGVPIGLSNLGELGVFMFSTILMGTIGAETLAAHAVALRMAGVIYAIPLGLSQAATIRVGYAAGANDTEAMSHSARTALILATAVGLFYLFAVWGFNHDIAVLFLGDASGAVLSQAALFLLVLAIMQPLDCVGTVAAGALRGVKDTRVPMMISLAGHWGFGFISGLLLAFVFDLDGLGIWLGLGIGATVFALGTMGRLLAYWNRYVLPSAHPGKAIYGTASS